MEESNFGTHSHCCTCGHTEGRRMTFKIPVGKISDFNPKWWEFWHWGKKKIRAKEAQKSLKELMALYKEDIFLDETEILLPKPMKYTKDENKKEDK
jgi:hypothetical protein